MYRNLLICLLVSIALVCALEDANNTITNSTTSSPNISTTATPPKLSTTLGPNTTTTSKPETTTTQITTAKPTTVTVTTTVAPNPPPMPKPEKFTGNVKDDKKTCIIVQFSVLITIKYNNTNNEEKTTGFTIPSNATVDTKSSHCSHENTTSPEAITISFKDEENTSANLTLTFNVTDHKTVVVESIELLFIATQTLMPGLDSKLIGKPVMAEKNNLSLFEVASVHSYFCSAVQSAKLDIHEDRINSVQIEFTDSKVEAYMNESNKGNFDSEIDCKSADISDVVPIAVGAALAGLVVIVLIAYFIGRRRSRRLAYQSV